MQDLSSAVFHPAYQPKTKKDIYFWLPALAWSLIPLAYSVFADFGQMPGASAARWVGLVGFALYGFINHFSKNKWKPNAYDHVAFFLFGIITLVTFYFFQPVGIYKAASCLLAYLYITWGIGSLITNFNDLISIAKKFLLITTGLLGVGVIGNMLGILPIPGGAPSGIFGNPNATGGFVIFVPLAVWFVILNHKRRILRWVPLVTILIAIALCRARSPLIGILVFFFYFFICQYRFQKKDKLSLYAGLILFVGIAIFAVSLIADTYSFRVASQEFMSSLTDPSSEGLTSYRTNIVWPIYLREINRSWTSLLFGHGWASEETLLLEMRAVDPRIAAINAGTAHSAYIGLTYQIGLAGSILMFGSLWLLVYQVLKESSRILDKERFQFRVAVSGSVLIALCTAFFETGVYNIGAFHALPTWVAVYMVVRSKFL